MKISEYKKICNDVEVSETVLTHYNDAINQIKSESKVKSQGKIVGTLSKVAIIFLSLSVLSGFTILSVKAYISHMEELNNMKDEEIIEMYENVFRYDSGYMSRALSSEEERRFDELYDLYCRDLAEPDGEVAVISTKAEYKGVGVAFATDDGILYMPEDEMTDEELLEYVVFCLLRRYVDYEAYVKASNPSYYMNYLESMTTEEVDEIYVSYYSANTETGFYNRDLTFDELGRRKVLKKLYKENGMLPKQKLMNIQSAEEYTGEGIAFCTADCTYYFPKRELTDEELLELIDFQIKVEYCRQRIEEEIDRGLRSGWPHIEYVKRDRIITIDQDIEVDENILEQPWIAAYEKVLEQYYMKNKEYYEDPERYYANICFIYLNDDDIPELLFSHGYTDMDYDDRCNTRDYLYTYRDGEAVLLTPEIDTPDDFYGYQKPFSYVERKGMVYCDYYYIYSFSTYDDSTGMIDSVSDKMSRMDVWDFDTLTCTSSDSNIEMLHAVYNYEKEEYDDAAFSNEYYINVKDIIRDKNTGNVKEIVGEKVDKQTYEAAERALWNGEEITTLSVDDFDKIYSDDNIREALAKCYN